MNLSFNFSMAGFLLVLLPMLPNVLYFIFSEKLFNYGKDKNKILNSA